MRAMYEGGNALLRSTGGGFEKFDSIGRNVTYDKTDPTHSLPIGHFDPQKMREVRGEVEVGLRKTEVGKIEFFEVIQV
jgi:hypothetical protein